MSAALADAVDANIKGQAAADLVLDDIRRGTSHPDALRVAAMAAWAAGGTPQLVGFHRRCAKALERGMQA